MTELIFGLLCSVAVFALAMRRAPLWLWAGTFALATFVLQTGLVRGTFSVPAFGWLALLGWSPAVLLALLSVPKLRRAVLVEPAYHAVRKALPKVSDTEQ